MAHLDEAEGGTMRKLLLLALMGTVQQPAGRSAGLDTPPTLLNLGSNVSDGSVSVACAGKEPYSQLSCKVYRLWVKQQPIEEYQKSRAALQKDLATRSEADLLKMRQDRCSDLKSVSAEFEKKFEGYSPGRAVSARDGYEQMKAVCDCATKQCITSVMLEQQTHEQNECTVHSAVFPVDFVKVADNKWVSNNGPEGICGVVSVFTIEHEPSSTSLWTYTEHYTYTNNSAGFCKGLPDSETSAYSWKSGTNVRLKCEEIKFDTTPEWQ
jgi:hypothetical protein